MISFKVLWTALVSSTSVLASQVSSSSISSLRPLVLWHGLGSSEGHDLFTSTDRGLVGDYYASNGMLDFASLIKDIHPGIFVHSVYIDQDEDKDTRAGFVRLLQQPK